MRRIVMVVLLVSGALLVPTQAAFAACHQFRVRVSPASVAEGGAVTVTVSRDGAVNPSHIDLASVDETAHAPGDYAAIARTVSFTNDTQQTFTLQTSDDNSTESAETFRLHLSNPGGCTVNPNFDVGPDAAVTVVDNDAATPTVSPTPSPSTAPAPSPSTGPTTGQNAGGGLVRTGVDLAAAGLGGALILVGVGVLVIARRRLT